MFVCGIYQQAKVALNLKRRRLLIAFTGFTGCRAASGGMGSMISNTTVRSPSEDASVLQLHKHRSPSLLQERVKFLVKDMVPLLPNKFKQVNLENSGDPGTVRIMQWNILAQALSLGKDNFIKCPHDALSWDLRRLRIIESILDVLPDILCLQEVDHYPFLEEVLATVGYIGNFCPKPDSPCLYVNDSNGPDGCAAFYRSDKFEEIQRHNFVLQADGAATNQVCTTVTLRCKSSGKTFTVGVTHLKAKYGWDDLRHKQGVYMLEYLHKNLPASALFLCGDFNAEPTELVHKACLDSPLGLKSAYAVVSENGLMEPAYTTWKIRGGPKEGNEVEVRRTIDYIWYSEDSLKVTALKELPTGDEIGAGRVPSFAYPSDHFSLAADFKFV